MSAVIYFILGWLWYSPVLFAKPWDALTGFKPEEMKPIPGPFIFSFALELLAAYGLACVISAVNAITFTNGAMIGLMTGVAFAASAGGSNYAFEGKPAKLFFINFGYPVAAYVVIGGVLAVWK